jgi:prepilin-type N-terminal cleavage/methylation domain-containing protein
MQKRIKGFTLLEVLLVIAAIGILAAIVLIAINPNKQLAQARNAERRSEVNTLYKALEQYLIDNQGYPVGITETEQDICINNNTTGCVNLGVLVPDYVAGIPKDPSGISYKIGIVDSRVRVRASEAELGSTIAISGSGGNVVASIAFDLNISPAISGKTQWNFLSDGSLNFSTYGEWTIIPLRDITVNTKIWGAGGASGAAWTTSNSLTEISRMGSGGSGGYSTGSIILTTGNTYIIQVGEGGSRRNGIDSNGGATYRAGGSNSNIGGAQGGGYSGIFITSVIQSNIVIMAGGGGAGYDQDGGWCPSSGSSGAGGGNDAQNGFSAGFQGGVGATQIAGGGPAAFNNTTAGSALRGGLAGNAHFHSGGGGGGYFGGGGGNICGGGGGSGFINPAFVINGSTQTGNGSTPANSSDPMRLDSGQGSDSTSKATDGRIILMPI